MLWALGRSSTQKTSAPSSRPARTLGHQHPISKNKGRRPQLKPFFSTTKINKLELFRGKVLNLPVAGLYCMFMQMVAAADAIKARYESISSTTIQSKKLAQDALRCKG